MSQATHDALLSGCQFLTQRRDWAQAGEQRRAVSTGLALAPRSNTLSLLRLLGVCSSRAGTSTGIGGKCDQRPSRAFKQVAHTAQTVRCSR